DLSLRVIAGLELLCGEGVVVDERQVVLIEATVCCKQAARVTLCLGFFRSLDINVTVDAQAGAGRDELTDGDCLLEADERIAGSLQGGLREHAGGLLERRSPQP